jgi:hypothetical protein
LSELPINGLTTIYAQSLFNQENSIAHEDEALTYLKLTTQEEKHTTHKLLGN